jgi:hypothetical protein
MPCTRCRPNPETLSAYRETESDTVTVPIDGHGVQWCGDWVGLGVALQAYRYRIPYAVRPTRLRRTGGRGPKYSNPHTLSAVRTASVVKRQNDIVEEILEYGNQRKTSNEKAPPPVSAERPAPPPARRQRRGDENALPMCSRMARARVQPRAAMQTPARAVEQLSASRVPWAHVRRVTITLPRSGSRLGCSGRPGGRCVWRGARPLALGPRRLELLRA